MTALAAFLMGSPTASGGSLFAAKDGDAFADGYAPPNQQFLTTNNVVVTVSGGAGPVTHSWAFVSGDAVLSISSLTASTVNWSATVGLAGKSAAWRDTVSDGVSFVTVDVDVAAQVF